MRISKLKDLKKAFSKPKNGFHVIRFMGMDDFLVMETKATEQADRIILSQYGIRNSSRLEEE